MTKGAKKETIIMQSGLINGQVEITNEVAYGPYSVILAQITNGVAI